LQKTGHAVAKFAEPKKENKLIVLDANIESGISSVTILAVDSSEFCVNFALCKLNSVPNSV